MGMKLVQIMYGFNWKILYLQINVIIYSMTKCLSHQPEGATIDRHTSILLDLKNRALVYEYMDIIVEESYVIPLQIRRRFVAGSPRGHVSLCGDVVGPSFPNDVSWFGVGSV